MRVLSACCYVYKLNCESLLCCVICTEGKCIIDGCDSSFTTDISLLKHNNSMSVAELLVGFFKFYANFDFPANVLSPRLGHTVDVNEFIGRQSSDSRVTHFKVSLSALVTLI